jgi:hypothetical protein
LGTSLAEKVVNEDKADVKLKWIVGIPVIGYFWLLRQATRETISRYRQVVIFNTVPFLVLGFVTPIATEVLNGWRIGALALELGLIFYAIVFVLLDPTITKIETSMQASGKYRNSGWYRYFGWAQLDGLTRKQVWQRLLVFNYHELMFAFVGLIVSTSIIILG